MLDIRELEQQWKRYKIKQYLNYIKIGGGVFVVLGVIIFTASTLSKDDKEDNKPKMVVSKQKVESKPAVNQVAQEQQKENPDNKTDKQKVEKSTKSVEETPKIAVANNRNYQNSNPDSNIQTDNRVKESRIEKSPKKESGMFLDIGEPESNIDNTPKEKKHKMDLTIITPNSKKIIVGIEKRFRATRSYDDALYLANYYYERKLYSKAAYWSLQANIIDSDGEESWLLFAKAKAKLGKRAEAIKVLKAYYEKSASPDARALMDDIRKGTKF